MYIVTYSPKGRNISSGIYSSCVLLDHFLCNPAVLESIGYRMRAHRLINESNTTLGLRKIWTVCLSDWLINCKHGILAHSPPTRPIFLAIQLYCSGFSVSLTSYDSRLTLIRLDGQKNWTGMSTVCSKQNTSS